MPQTPLDKLQRLLRDLFQLDLADLDFGIYRLFRMKRDEVTAFIDEQLPRSVGEAFGDVDEDRRTQAETELTDVRERLEREFPDEVIVLPDGSLGDVARNATGATVRELVELHDVAHARLTAAQASDTQNAEVFNHLYAFFHRYYDDGDFVPHRRYGAREHYTIPYNGEETHFHWANRGQHYVKSAETFRDYAFDVAGDLLASPRRVRFVLTSASVPPGDTKGDARYFFPSAEAIEWSEADATLTTWLPSSVGWLGAVLAFLALATIGMHSEDAPTVRGVYLVMEPAAWLVLVPLAFASLLTAVVSSLVSPWGLFRHTGSWRSSSSRYSPPSSCWSTWARFATWRTWRQIRPPISRWSGTPLPGSMLSSHFWYSSSPPGWRCTSRTA